MLRILKEFFHPQFKCRRIGHHFKKVSVVVRVRSKSTYAVCEDHYATLTKCTRCGRVKNVKLGGCKDSFQSVTMPSDMWDEMDSKGYVII